MNSMVIISAQHQRFSLPHECINYILKSRSSSYLAFIKLYKTCKYFYMKQKIFFTINYFHQYNPKYFSRYYRSPNDIPWWFSEKLTLFQAESIPSHQIYRCTIKEFDFKFSTITLNDFEIIIKENTIKFFHLFNSFIKNVDGSNVSMDFILQKLPNMERFYFDNFEVPLTHKMLKNIGGIKLWNKFQKIFVDINFTSNYFDPNLLLNFIKNNAASTFDAQIIIDGINSQSNFESFKLSTEMQLKAWNGIYVMEIYNKNVPPAITIQTMRKDHTKQEAKE